MSETSTKDHMGKWTELEEKCARLISHTKELENRWKDFCNLWLLLDFCLDLSRALSWMSANQTPRGHQRQSEQKKYHNELVNSDKNL